MHKLSRLLLSTCAAIACLGHGAMAAEYDEPLPSFAQLEAAGAVIGAVRIDAQDIFDMEDPRENFGIYRLLNVLHIQTRQSVIRRQLLFRSGERVSQRVMEETERLLRGNSYLYDVTIRPVAYRGGIVDIAVRTRDTWSLQPGAGAGGPRLPGSTGRAHPARANAGANPIADHWPDARTAARSAGGITCPRA